MKALAAKSKFAVRSIRHLAGALVVVSLFAFHANALPKKTRKSGRRVASVAKVPSRKPAQAAVRPASSTIVHAKANTHSSRIYPKLQNIDFGGRSFQYIEKVDERNAVTQQYLLGKERIEIINDRNGDGRIDSWDIYTPAGKMTFTNPYKGHLTSLDIEVSTRFGIMRYNYYWAPGIQSYVLFSQRGRPYKSFGKLQEEFIVGCKGRTQSEVDLGLLAEKLDTALDNGSLESELRSNLLNSAVDSSCKQGTYTAQTENIVNGLMKIAKSDGKKGGSQPFLQCMRNYNLDLHANRIEASGFAQYTSLVPTSKFEWKIACEKPNDDQWGEFSEGAGLSEAPTIKLFLDGSGMKEFTEKTNPTKADMEHAYAKLVFHEMLHFSAMGETNADVVEDCCAQPSPDPNSSECQFLKSLTQDNKMKQVFQNVIIERLGGANGEGSQNYAKLLDVIRRSSRNSDEAETKFNATLMNLAMEYNSLKDKDGCKPPAGSKDTLSETCLQRFENNAITQINDQYDPSDGSDCRKAADQQLKSAEEGRQTCLLMREILTSIVNDGTKTVALKKICPATVSTSTNGSTASYDPTSPFLKLLNLASSRLTQTVSASEKANSSESLKPTLCAIADDLRTGPINPSSDPIEDSDWMARGKDSNQGSGGTTDSNNQAITQTPSRGKTTVDYVGPSRPYFTNDSTTRTNTIVNHIQNTDKTISNFQSIAERSFNLLVPQAQAAAEAWQKDKLQTDSTYRKSDFRDGYALRPNGPATIGNPMGSFGQDGAGGASIPNSRSPASIASIGAVKEPGIKSGNTNARGTNGGGTAGEGPNGSSAKTKEAEATSDRPVRKLSPSEERALQALKEFLQKDDFTKVKKELDRPSVEAALLDHGVQVVDDTGRTYGAGFPDYRFVFDRKKSKLVPDQLPTRSPAKRGR